MLILQLLYLLLLALLVLFYVLYIDTFAMIMLLCAVTIPFLMLILLICLKCTSGASLTCDHDTCTAGESIPVTLTVRNRSPFSFPQARAVVILRHTFGTGREKLHLRFPLQARNLTRITFYVHADFCGAMELSLKRVSVFDYLRLFRTKITIRQKHSNVLVLPKCVALPVYNSSQPVLRPDSDSFGDRPGDDPSEIFGFHEYGPGDAVSRIHWKLSTKMDTLFVKEFSTPIEKSVLLLLDYHGSAQGSMQERIRKAETFLTLFYSIVCRMLEQQVWPVILWYDGLQDVLEQHQPQSVGHLADIFRSLYDSIGSMELDTEKLMDRISGEQYSSLTCISDQLSPTLLHMIDKQLDANQKNLLHVCSQYASGMEIPQLAETKLLYVHVGRIQEDISQLTI